MSAGDVALRLGLKKYPRSWRGDCPCCSYARSFSLRAGRHDTVRLFCSNGCTAEELDDAVTRAAGSAYKPPEPESDDQKQAARERKREAALKLWRSSRPDPRVTRYLASRGLASLATSPALRYRGDVPHPEGGGRWPAMVAAVANVAGDIVAVHRTYLARYGDGKADIEPAKASLGSFWGGSVRLAPHEPDKGLVVAEGIETAGSAGLLMGLPAWSAVSAGNLGKGLVLPEEVRHVVIAIDPDIAGESAAAAAASRWRAEGRKVQFARPDGRHDFNDLLLSLPNA